MNEMERRYAALRKLGLAEDEIAKIKRIDDMIVTRVRALCVELGYGAVAQAAVMLEKEWRENMVKPQGRRK